MKRIIFILCTLLMFLAIDIVIPEKCYADDKSDLIACYDFDGDLLDTLGNSTLTPFISNNDGYNHNNATQGFGTDEGIGGDTTYWYWTSTLRRGGGFRIDVNDTSIADNYSIGVRFVFDDVSSSSYDKIIDYKNLESDSGFYFLRRKLMFYPGGLSGENVYNGQTIIDIIATRNAVTGEFIAYTVQDGNLVHQFTYNDRTTNYSIVETVNGAMRLGFFHDDNRTSSEATSGGRVYSVKVWDGPISQVEAETAMDNKTELKFIASNKTSGDVPDAIEGEVGDEVTVDGNVNGLARDGYSFECWNTLENGTGDDYNAGDKYVIPEGGGKLYAKWTPISYNILYNLDDGTNDGVNPTTYNVETPDITLQDANKDGYTFDGWYDGDTDTANKVDTISTGSTGEVELWARWTPITYNITYHLDGGTNDSANPAAYTVESEDLELKDASKDSYVFKGWYDGDTNTANKVEMILNGSTGDMELWAKWEEIGATSIELSSHSEQYKKGITGSITATILPEDVTNKAVVWHNSNDNVVTIEQDINEINKLLITAKDVGRAEITATTADGLQSDSCIITVMSDEEQEDEDAGKGDVTGRLVDDKGNPLVGYHVTIYSSPITVVTDVNGCFSFSSVGFTSHTLIIEDQARLELGRYKLEFMQGSKTGFDILDKLIDITYTTSTISVDIPLQRNGEAIAIVEDKIQINNKSIDPTVKVENPHTGERYIDMGIISIIVICVITLLLIIILKRKPIM